MSRQPAERTLTADLLGRDVQLRYSETWVAYSLLGLRLVMAWTFLQAGLAKLFEGGLDDPLAWSAEQFLGNAVDPANPLYDVFQFFADYLAIIDPLVLFGQLLIGLALLFGIVFRFAACMGALMMVLFWTAAWNGGLMAGLPVDNGYVIDSSFVYVVILFGLGAWGAGRILGLDRVLEKHPIVQSRPWLSYVLG